MHFKQTCFSISGLTYEALQKDLVPKNYDWIYDNAMEKKMVTVQLHDYGNYMGERFMPTGERVFDETLFTESELKAMHTIAETFKTDTVNQIVNKSHQETALTDNVGDFGVISYEYGLGLRYPV